MTRRWHLSSHRASTPRCETITFKPLLETLVRFSVLCTPSPTGMPAATYCSRDWCRRNYCPTAVGITRLYLS